MLQSAAPDRAQPEESSRLRPKPVWMGRERFPYSVTDMTKQSPPVQTGSPSCRRVPCARRGGTPSGHVHTLG
ncbi:hypothetical protein BCEN4_40055 [Burkholderia cenocepacia]|nr:hypothetical protein BCEN4_40055 [Burkholderia cenocepacia]